MTDRGYRVATVKHHHWGDFEMDTPGKDSWRHARAGAVATALAGNRQLAVFEQRPERLHLDAVVERLAPARPDIVITEGYKDGPFPKIEVARAVVGAPLCCRDDQLWALVSDTDWSLDVPRFELNDITRIASFLLRQLGQAASGQCPVP